MYLLPDMISLLSFSAASGHLCPAERTRDDSYTFESASIRFEQNAADGDFREVVMG